MTTPIFSEPFGENVHDGQCISAHVGDLTFRATVSYDSGYGAPWEEHDGHGDVSEWTRRKKAPGERVLCAEERWHNPNRRYYNFAGAVAKAKREGWSAPDALGTDTPGQRAHKAAEHDFHVLREWCRGEWWWCSIAVTVHAHGVELARESLCGIEANYPGSDNSYLLDVANELTEQAEAVARANAHEIADTLGRL